jgi:hypothetical protein
VLTCGQTQVPMINSAQTAESPEMKIETALNCAPGLQTNLSVQEHCHLIVFPPGLDVLRFSNWSWTVWPHFVVNLCV